MNLQEAYDLIVQYCKKNNCDNCPFYETNKTYPEEVCLLAIGVAPCFWDDIKNEKNKKQYLRNRYY